MKTVERLAVREIQPLGWHANKRAAPLTEYRKRRRKRELREMVSMSPPTRGEKGSNNVERLAVYEIILLNWLTKDPAPLR